MVFLAWSLTSVRIVLSRYAALKDCLDGSVHFPMWLIAWFDTIKITVQLCTSLQSYKTLPLVKIRWHMLFIRAQTARPKSQPPPSHRPRPVIAAVVGGSNSPGGSTGQSDVSCGSPTSAAYRGVNKKSPHKNFHITSYVC